MGRMKELDLVIADYVGFNEIENGNDITFDCADPALYDCITKEINEHINGNRAEKDLSPEAMACWSEFVDCMQRGPVNYHERSDQ